MSHLCPLPSSLPPPSLLPPFLLPPSLSPPSLPSRRYVLTLENLRKQSQPIIGCWTSSRNMWTLRCVVYQPVVMIFILLHSDIKALAGSSVDRDGVSQRESRCVTEHHITLVHTSVTTLASNLRKRLGELLGRITAQVVYCHLFPPSSPHASLLLLFSDHKQCCPMGVVCEIPPRWQ